VPAGDLERTICDTVRNATSLKAKIRNIAKARNLAAQAILQNLYI
jgi:hypothetical protein